MFDINVRGTFFVSRLCIPFLKKSSNPHILNMSPPLNLDLKWLVPHAAYTMSKMNMTMVALALAEELRQDRDRKSTRLNSSHVAISYAVFCLKQKRQSKSPERARAWT